MITLTREELDELLQLRDWLTNMQNKAVRYATNADWHMRDEAYDEFQAAYERITDRDAP